LAKKARVYDGTAWQELASAQTDLTAYSTTAQIEALLSGSVAQVVTGTTSTEVSSTSATYVDTNLTATITPRYASSKILIIVDQFVRLLPGGGTPGTGSLQILRNATTVWTPGQPYALTSNVDNRLVFSMNYLDSPATTSATTYKTQFARYDGTIYVNPNSCKSQITLMEIRA
jgi:hypothetical protein